MQPCISYFVGLINSQFSRDQAKNGPGYVKHLDEAIISQGREHCISIAFFTSLFVVDLNNKKECKKLTSGLPNAVINLSKELEIRKKELVSLDEQSRLTVFDQTRCPDERKSINERIAVITILFDRFTKIQSAIKAGSTLKEACKPFELFHNRNSIFINNFEYTNPQLFIENQLEINKLRKISKI